MNKIKNRSWTYIAPLVLKDLNINPKGISNSFIFDINNPEFNKDKIEGLFFLVNYQNESEKSFIYNPNCKYCESINDKYFMVFLLCNIDYIDDITYAVEGKFSKLSNEAKSQIISYHKLRMDNPIIDILNKSPIYRKKLEKNLACKIPEHAELGDIFNLQNEIYNTKVKKVYE